ncbi:MAG: DMT family transporter [Paracoccaceae bacterium]
MERKDHIDLFGAASLTGFALFLAVNQIIIKFVNQGLQPVFFAGARSLIGLVALTIWMIWRGHAFRFDRCYLLPGLAMGLAFSAEFLLLFIALDLTTVSHASILLYSMPVWLTIGAHFLLPGERINPLKALGLVAAFSGVAWALMDRGAGQAEGQVSLLGDLCALLASWGWVSITLLARGTRLREVRPEMQLFWQVAVSGPVLLLAAMFFGPLVRDLAPIHLAGLFYQGIVVVAAGFAFWFWLLSIYPAASVASFSFLSPIFGVLLGWLILSEPVGPATLVSAALVAVGIILINRPASKPSATSPKG